MKNLIYILLFVLFTFCLIMINCNDKTFYYDIKKENEIAKQDGYASYYMATKISAITEENKEGIKPIQNSAVSVRSVSKIDPRINYDIFASGTSDINGFIDVFSINKKVHEDKHIEVFCAAGTEYHNTYTYVTVSSNRNNDVTANYLTQDSYINLPIVIIPKAIIQHKDKDGNTKYGIGELAKNIDNAGGNIFFIKIGFLMNDISYFPLDIDEKIHPDFYFETMLLPFTEYDKMYINGTQIINDKIVKSKASFVYAFNNPYADKNEDNEYVNMYIPDSGVITTAYTNSRTNADFTVRISAVRNINDEILTVYFLTGIFTSFEQVMEMYKDYLS